MARIRTIKPEFWSDEKLSTFDPVTRLVFLGLISQADDAGRLVDNVKLLDGLLFPETDDTCRDALDTLATHSRVVRYRSASGQRLIQIANWDRHQRVDRPSKHNLPGPDDPGSEVAHPQHDTELLRDTRDTLATHSRGPIAPTVYHVPSTGDHVTDTVADATEAAPRGVAPLEVVAVEGEPAEPHTPPNSNPEEGPEPDSPAAPESEKDVRRRMNAIAAPLIREHLWLGKEPPLGATRKYPDWGMPRELNILAGLMKDHKATPEEIGAVVEYARLVLEFGPDEPLSALIFQVEGRRDRFRQVLDYVQVRRAKEEKLREEREPKPAGNVRIQLHVA